MRPNDLARVALLLSVTAGTAAPALGQTRDRDWCDQWSGDRARFCEVREFTLDARASLSVDGRQNGGIRVDGWDRNAIQVRAKVQAWGDDEEEARERARRIEIETAGTIRATGAGGNWAVSYEIMVPRRIDLALDTHNGGITIAGVLGDISFDAVNGGVRLEGVGGHVRGETTNGGLTIELTGEEWEGDALDVRTTNGGVRIEVPRDYNARLETGTVNGGMTVDFPVTVQGRIGRELAVTLGDGGRLVRAVTTNGGVVVRRR